MNAATLRHVPWTCEWGRFGVAVEQVTPQESQVDDVFWVCHHPAIAPGLKTVCSDECRTCPLWNSASRFSSSASARLS
jgi:hypothetical protein